MKKLNKRIIYGLSMSVIFAVSFIAAFFSAKDMVTNRFFSANLSTMLLEPKWKQYNAENIVPEQVIDKDPCVTNDGEVDAYVYIEVSVPYYMENVNVENSTGVLVKDDGTNLLSKSALPVFKFIADGVDNDNNYNALNSTLDSREQDVNDANWEIVGTPEVSGTGSSGVIKYVYAYTDGAGNLKELKPGDTTITLFDKVKLINLRENKTYSLDYTFENYPLGIQVTHKSIQTGLGVNTIDGVWALIKDE